MIEDRINPIKASDSIRETYLRYLTTTFGLKNSELARQFRIISRESKGLFRGPILETTPNYRKGKSLIELITEKGSFLSEGFVEYAPGMDRQKVENHLPLNRLLYSHQEKALKKIAGENRNVVIATGTGSGKTECFLLPIINYLLKERSGGTLGPGVRAMLLYPMNALANDQVARLRNILPPETGITFGRYTGQTQQGYYNGLAEFKKENNGETPSPNELFCRDQILGIEPLAKDWPHRDWPVFLGPPHILLTNFAMLEYLLMRPADSGLFDGAAGNTWRFIVLDEAHVYSGAMGSEIGYLMRRLKDRVCRSQQGRLLCIATSATVGADDEKSREIIAESFQNLFGEQFEKQDLITGDIIPPEESLTDFPEWGKGSSAFYEKLERIAGKFHVSTESFCKDLETWSEVTEPGFPDEASIRKAIGKISRIQTPEDAVNRFLFCVLAGDCNIRTLIERLEKAPIDMASPVEIVGDRFHPFSEVEGVQKHLVRLVNLASKARMSKDTAPLLAARYHFFVRSLEGISVKMLNRDEKGNLEIKPRLLLGRQKVLPGNPEGKSNAFELRACGRCGQTFLHGHLTDDNRFVSYYQRTRLEEGPKKSEYLSIDLEQIVESAEDEIPLRDEKQPASEVEEDSPKKQPFKVARTLLGETEFMCPRCGFLSGDDLHSCEYCRRKHEIISDKWVKVRRLFSENGTVVKVCPACGAQRNYGGSIIRPFSPGDDAAGTVLAQSLMTHIPPTSEKPVTPEPVESMEQGRFSALKKTTDKKILAGKRRLLAFSDSRQDAAYFATYLDRTSNQILHRQLILKAAEKILHQFQDTKYFSPGDLIAPLKEEAQKVGLFGPSVDDIEKTSTVSSWINAELIGIQKRHGLEGVGLITWELKYRRKLIEKIVSHNDGLIEDYGLTSEEFICLMEIFLTELRRQNVLQPLNGVDIRDTYFWPRNRPYSIRKNDVNPKLSIASWIPQASRNMRSDFIERLLIKTGQKTDKKTIENILTDLWDLSKGCEGIWEEVPSVNTLWGGMGKDGIVFRVRWDAWRGRLNTIEDSATLFKCETCGNLAHIDLKGVCPSYRCPGKLTPVDFNVEFSDNHYRFLYGVAPVQISVQEHTAQITTQEGAQRQREFSNDEKPLNVLSCSTTFELGVDVGELHAVFLRNVPPAIANYIQRSGRAGRRLSAAAFVLTFCRSRPHDLGYFDSAINLIQGKIPPTIIKIENTRIARRHLHAVALSHFWRNEHPELFNGPENKYRGQVQWLFFNASKTGSELIHSWLAGRPKELLDIVWRIFSSRMREELGLETWQWTGEFVRLEKTGKQIMWDGSLGLAQTELCSEYDQYEKLQNEIPELFNYAKAQRKRILGRQILDYLASRNVLPKYGFPVDVIQLKLESKDDWAQRVELDRDLKLALGEYAPGCTLVANGRVIKSYAIEKIKGKAWPEYRFAVCNSCGRFHHSDSSHGKMDNICDCGFELNKSELKGNFIEPIFGFRTQLHEDGQKPVEVRPERTYTTRVFFSHYKDAHDHEPFMPEGNPDPRMGIKIEKRYSRSGMLAVLNTAGANRGFWICTFCGFGHPVVSAKPSSHKTPWGKPCKGKLIPLALGHRFQSDVLEIRFRGGDTARLEQGFWLSLTAALLSGASKALNIERDDIDGTVLRFGGEGHRSIVLFDSVPGGAGHVRRIGMNLAKVMEEAYNVAENCPGCSRDQSCNACLRTFRNQYAHDLLSRGPVADFIAKTTSGLYRRNEDGYFSLGLTDTRRWFLNQIRRSQRIDLVLENLPEFSGIASLENEWFNVLYELAGIEIKIRIFFTGDLKKISAKPEGKIELHKLALLSEFENVEIFANPPGDSYSETLYLQAVGNEFAARWKRDQNPFDTLTNIEITVLPEYLNKVKLRFNSMAADGQNHVLNPAEIEKFLERAKVLRIAKGQALNWKDILEDHLPDDIEDIQIYDRFIRNRFQFKSLEMLLDFFLNSCEKNTLKIHITTTADQDKKNNVQDQFRNIQQCFPKNKIQYDIKDAAAELPHYRVIKIKNQICEYCLWLDKGVHIFWFEDMKKFQTLDTYIVIEKKQLNSGYQQISKR